MLVKLFAKERGYFRSLSRSSSALEKEINNWLRENPKIQIKDIQQTSCGGSLEPSKTIISVWYQDDVSELRD